MNKIAVKLSVFAVILLVCLQAGFLIFIVREGALTKHQLLNVRLPFAGNNLPRHYSYFSNQEFFDEAYQAAEGQTPETKSKIYGGIVPHHLIVKDKIAAFFARLGLNDYQTIILIGPNHFDTGHKGIILSHAQWQTPYGILEPDLKLIKTISKLSFAGIDELAMSGEHSISGLVSFIKKSLPAVKIAPIILSNNVSAEEAQSLADAIFSQSESDKTLVLASVDFSHYLPTHAADFHDLKSKSVIENFDFSRIYNLEIDSSPSVYVLLKYLELAGAQKSQIIFSTNSGLLTGKPDEPGTSHQFFYFTKGEKINKLTAVNFLFFGDVMLDRHAGEKIDQNGLDYIFAKLAGEENRFFKGIDLVSANLEGAVTNNGAHYPPALAYDFAFAPELIIQLKRYNFNFFDLANNHFFDQGSRGISETRENLSQLGFNYSGCPDGEVGECSSAIVEIGSQNIGMVGFSVVYSRLDLILAQKIISQLSSQTDLVIVNIHWGVEYEHQFNKTQQSIAYSLIDSGAGIIIGHHPHVAQGMEIYQNKPIFYSLGNFVFDQYFSQDTQEGLAIGLNLTNGERRFFLFPLQSHLSQVELMSGKAKQEFLRQLADKWSTLDQKYKEQIKAGMLALD